MLYCSFFLEGMLQGSNHYGFLGLEAASQACLFLDYVIREQASWGLSSSPWGLWVLLAHSDKVAGQWPVRPSERCCVLQLLRHYYQPLPNQVSLGSVAPHPYVNPLACSQLGIHAGHFFGRESAIFFCKCTSFVGPSESQTIPKENRRTDMWVALLLLQSQVLMYFGPLD